MQESWQTNYNDIKEEIERFEEMENGGKSCYFDVHTLEGIFDFYADKFQFDKAERVIRLGIRQHPDATSLQAKHAIVLIEKGDDQAALRLMERLTSLEQSNPEVFLNLGLVYLRSRRTAEGIRAFGKALELTFEEREETLLDIAVYLNQYDQFAACIEVLSAPENDYPDNDALLFELAFAYDKLNRVEEGMETYQKLLDIDPFSENAWYNLGILYIKKEDYNSAIDCYDYTLAINPSHAEALFNKANSLVNLNQPAEAIELYIEYISFGYDQLLPLYYIADCYDQMGQRDMALRFYRHTIETDPFYYPAWLNYLAHLINNNLVDEALEASQEALEYHKDVGELYYLRARVLLLAGDFKKALPALEFCVKEDPGNLRNLYELFQVQRTLYPRRKPLKMLQTWLQRYPNSEAVHYLLAAYFLLEERSLKTAALHLEQALAENPGDLDLLLDFYPELEQMIQKSKKLSQLLEMHTNYEF